MREIGLELRIEDVHFMNFMKFYEIYEIYEFYGIL